MAETSEEVPLLPQHTKRAMIALVQLFLFSVGMFTLPFVAFFAMKHFLTEYYPVEHFTRVVWSVVSAVMVVNIIIGIYAYKAYHEKEYDEDGNEIDQNTYQPPPETEKRDLNLKQD